MKSPIGLGICHSNLKTSIFEIRFCLLKVYEDAERLQGVLKKKLEDLPPHIPPEIGHTIKSETSHQTSVSSSV